MIILLFICTECLSVNNPDEEELREEALEAIPGDTKGIVTHVTDGDTFTVELEDGEEEYVRLISVNAPETCHYNSISNCEPEPFSEEAVAFTRETLQGETVYLEQDELERDQNGYMLFYVYLESTEMYQSMLLREGLAEVAVNEPNIKYQQELKESAEQAKTDSKGIWQQ
ncbi:thermonuclease family protein [Terribacillus saccharophilus]|uniref:thermonuclease family protein n=1 Tax=Terribacillus saccharophilus TaxID=361277 RepID=UPI0037F55A3C